MWMHNITTLDNSGFTVLNLVFAFAVYSCDWYLEHRMYICRNAYREAALSWQKCGTSIGSHDWSTWHSFRRIYFQGEFTSLLLKMIKSPRRSCFPKKCSCFQTLFKFSNWFRGYKKKSCFPKTFVFPNIVPLQTLFLVRNRLGVDTETTSDHMCLVPSVRITYKCLFSVKKGVMIQLHSTWAG